MSSVLGAVSTGAAAGALGWRCLRPRRSPRARLALYLEVPRAHLGAPPLAGPGPLFPREATRRVLGPLAGGVLSKLERWVGAVPGPQLELALRQAGAPMTPDEYRRRYVRWLVGLPLALGACGALTGKAAVVVLCFLAGLFAGARRMPETVRRLARTRNEQLRGDLPAVSAVLALKVDNNKSLITAVAEVVSEGNGAVVADLARAVNLVNAGYGEGAAFELIAGESAEPAAGRFYRFLAVATAGAIDLARALLDQANELRAQRREEVERNSARRQMALVVPSFVFMAPVLFMFLLAPLPQMLFGK